MGGKRGNENSQESKETYDQIQDAGGGEVEYGMRKASDSTLRQRKFLSVTRKGAWAKKVAAPSQSKTTHNPFSKLGKSSPSPVTTSNLTKTNPFSGISLAPSSNVVAPSKTAVKKPPQTFACKADKLNYNFLSFIVQDSEDINYDCIWEVQTKDYQVHAASVDKKERGMLERKKSATSNAASITNSFPVSTANCNAVSISSNQQCKSTPDPFHSISLAQKSVTAPAASSASQDEDAFPREKPEVALRESNNDEECLFEVKAKHFVLTGEGWKGRGSGTLRVYKNKLLANKKRLVIRNVVGKVQLNVSLANGMTFQKVVPKRASKNASFQFHAKLEEGKEMTLIMISVAHDKIIALLNILETLTK